jgi:hypothetical protein
MKHISSIFLTAVFLLAGNAGMAQTPKTNDAVRASSDPVVVEKLRAIVSLRQSMAESNERAVKSGKGEGDGRYEIALAEARLQLACELGQREEKLTALKDIVKVQQRRLQEAEKRVATGTASPEDVGTIRVAVLEAEVRLLRAQDGSKTP